MYYCYKGSWNLKDRGPHFVIHSWSLPFKTVPYRPISITATPPHHEKACMWTVKWVEGSVWLYGTPNFVNMILRAIFHHEFYGGKVVDFWRVGSDMKNSSGNISTFKIFFLKKKTVLLFFFIFQMHNRICLALVCFLREWRKEDLQCLKLVSGHLFNMHASLEQKHSTLSKLRRSLVACINIKDSHASRNLFLEKFYWELKKIVRFFFQ